MITNSDMTLFHKTIRDNHIEQWTKKNIEKVWFIGGKGCNTQKGYANANDVQIRIPYNLNTNVNINDFKIGDIVCKGTISNNITNPDDLEEYYNITSISDNNFGKEPHIHLGGK